MVNVSITAGTTRQSSNIAVKLPELFLVDLKINSP
jgi:hypothetical protein